MRRLALLLLLLALAVGACGDDDAPVAPATTPERTSTGSREAPAADTRPRGEPIADRARRHRRTLRSRDPVGVIHFPSEDARAIVQVGFDQATIDDGPGWYPRSRLPGEGRLVYIAGHNRTHGGPFGPVARLRRGDVVTLELPYATVTYAVTRRRLVSERDASILRSPPSEVLRLQTSTVPSGQRRIVVEAGIDAIVPR